VAKPLDDRSNKELEDGLQQDEFGPRKTAFAKELLRRREEARGGLKYILEWLPSVWRCSKDFGGGMASKQKNPAARCPR
jgi:hypothetical protein